MDRLVHTPALVTVLGIRDGKRCGVLGAKHPLVGFKV